MAEKDRFTQNSSIANNSNHKLFILLLQEKPLAPTQIHILLFKFQSSFAIELSLSLCLHIAIAGSRFFTCAGAGVCLRILYTVDASTNRYTLYRLYKRITRTTHRSLHLPSDRLFPIGLFNLLAYDSVAHSWHTKSRLSPQMESLFTSNVNTFTHIHSLTHNSRCRQAFQTKLCPTAKSHLLPQHLPSPSLNFIFIFLFKLNWYCTLFYKNSFRV